MREDALKYAGRGFRVLPLVPKGKKPTFKTGKLHAAASREPAKIDEWFPDDTRRNLGTVAGPDEFDGRGLFALDVDGADGVAELGRLLGAERLIPTWRVRSGREGIGEHVYYHGKVKSSSANGLEVRSEGKILVLPPSVHKSGRRYEVVQPERLIADAPEWLIKILNERESAGGKRERKQKAATVPNSVVPEYLRLSVLPRLADRAAADFLIVEPEDLLAAAAVLPNPDLPWESEEGGFNEIGLAFWRVSGGQMYGLEAFKIVAAKSKKWDGGKECEERWANYAVSPPTDYTFGSIKFWIWRVIPGWEVPSREPKAIQSKEVAPEPEAKPQADDFFKPEEGKVNGHATLAQFFKDIDLDKPGNPLIKLNEKFAVIGDLGGKCLVMSWVASKVDRAVNVPSFQTFKSFTERFGHKYIMVKRDGKDGEVVEEAKQLGAYYLKWPHRRTFEGIDLVPNGERELPGKVLNLWQGFAIEPAAGRWPLMRRHILDVLAAGDVASARYIVGWAAWSVQHPGERAEAALVLKGGKGSGKGTFADAMRQIFGQHGLHIFNSKHLVGAFNGHLRNCLFLFADEAFWAGDKHGEAVLKGMLTEPVLMIEQKGIDATAWKNRLHVIMAANAEWVVPASHDERRYAVFEVSSARMNDEAYFAALRAEMAGGGLAAMLYDLLALDLKDWHPRKIVRTAALAEQKARSLDPRHEWWESVLQSGVLPGRRDATHGAIPATTVYDRARDDVPKLKEASATALGRFLRGFGAEGLHRENGNYWRFPNLIEARRLWTIKFGEWPWRNTLADWHP
jgi:hypothetical protein